MKPQLPSFAGAEIAYRQNRIRADFAAAAPAPKERTERAHRVARRRNVVLRHLGAGA